MSSDTIRSASVAAAALLGSAVVASAQDASTPFRDWTIELSHAVGLESVAARLMLAQHYEPPLDAVLVDQFYALSERQWARFAGSLAAADGEIAQRLHGALEQTARAAEKGGDASAAAAEAQALLVDARAALLPEGLWDSPGFRGALIVDLLLLEGGIAESYEEAIEEIWEYPGGWAGLQRVDALWARIADLATDDLRADAEEMITVLHELFPGPGPPASVVGWNPEEVEAPAQRLSGLIEQIVVADLFPGRDLAALAGHLAATVSEGCALYESRDDARAVEHIIAALALYDAHLAATARLFAGEAGERAAGSFARLVGLEEDEADEGRDAHTAGAGSAALLYSAEACANLAAALRDIRKAVGG